VGFQRLALPEKLPKHLSVSSIQQYEKCPYAWQQKYLKKRRIPFIAPPPVFGSIFAKSMEQLHLGRDAEVSFVKMHASESERLRKHGVILEHDAEYGLSLSRLYQELPPFEGQPERSFTLMLPERFRCPLPIQGFMDLSTMGGVIEMKTSRANWTQARADDEYQAACYDWAWEELEHRDCGEVRYLVFGTMWPSLKQIVTHPTPDKFERFGKAAGDAYRHIVAKDFARFCGRCDFCLADGKTLERAA
jgi:hypothetical protein